VSGIVAGKSDTASGVAKEANLIAVQVFSRVGTGVGSYSSDQILGLQRVYALRGNYAIDAVNMSIGGGSYSANCDSSQSATKAAIDNLRSVGIATVIASGNDGANSAMSAPACISTAVSVGAVNSRAGFDNTCTNKWAVLGTSAVDKISCYSNSTSFLSLLAPGSQINSSIPGGGFATWNGTSMATPHVAGAWAVYKQKYPNASVATALAAFQQTGLGILDPRNNITKPRINLSNALNLTPQDLINCGAKCSITLNLGDQITLNSSPTGNHVFGAWSDACSGTNSICTVQVSGDATLSATFDTLQVSRAKKIIPVLMMLLED
jgi:subtilisin family serine protease